MKSIMLCSVIGFAAAIVAAAFHGPPIGHNDGNVSEYCSLNNQPVFDLAIDGADSPFLMIKVEQAVPTDYGPAFANIEQNAPSDGARCGLFAATTIMSNSRAARDCLHNHDYGPTAGYHAIHYLYQRTIAHAGLDDVLIDTALTPLPLTG